MTSNALPVARKWGTATWIAILTTVIVAMLMSIFIGRWQRSRALSAESEQRIELANKVQSDLLDMETGQRGFLLAGEESYLAPYRSAAARLHSDTTALLAAVKGLPLTVAKTAEITALTRLKAQELDSTIALYRAGRQADASSLVRSDSGKRLMDSVRSFVGDIISREREVQRDRARRETAFARLVWVTLVLGTLVTVAVLFLLRASLLKYAEAQRAAMRELDKQLSAIEEQSRQLSLSQGSASPTAPLSANTELAPGDPSQ